MAAKRVFVAGATGFLGRAMTELDPAEHGCELVLQVRPGSSSRQRLADDARVVEVSLEDEDALAQAMAGCDSVVQLIGTTRARFADNGDYEAVDYGTTVKLVAAAERAGVEQFVFLSSVGAGTGLGRYFHFKREAERAVRASAMTSTCLRAPWIGGDKEHPERRSFAAIGAFLRGFADTPLGGPALDLRPMNVVLQARVILHVVREGGPTGVLRGRRMWELAKDNHLYEWTR
jgi:NADH dehydrogenase